MPEEQNIVTPPSSPRTRAEADLEKLASELSRRNGLARKLDRAWQVFRHYRKRQLVNRGWKVVCARLGGGRISAPVRCEEYTIREGATERLAKILISRQPRAAASRKELQADLASAKLTLLGQQVDFQGEIDWEGRRQRHPSRLWTFQLHYQDYLADLVVRREGDDEGAPNETTWHLVWSLVDKWIAANPLPRSWREGDAWHPYCISRRLPIWMLLWTRGPSVHTQQASVLASIAAQVQVLAAHLEFDLGGNHLLENLTAWGMAACFLNGPESDQWLAKLEMLLERELREQILPHGEHYERAPMYHCQVLGNLLQLALLAEEARPSLAELCRKQAARMLEFLDGVLHPDGEVPLLGDSCWGEAHSVAEIRHWAKEAGVKDVMHRDSGAAAIGPYWVCRQENDILILDGGAVGARELPGHAHCDLTALEASVAGRRWLVDSGLFDYDESTMRTYCRSSLAHNVVTVDDENSCDIWSRFRMGRRGHITRFESGTQGEFAWCQASHDGYRNQGVPRLTRLLVAHASGTWVCIEYAEAKSRPKLAGRLHLRPGIEVVVEQSDLLRLTDQEEQRWLCSLGCQPWSLEQGWYCPRFGVRARSQVLRYEPTAEAAGAAVWGWTLARTEEECARIAFHEDPRIGLRLSVGKEPRDFQWYF